LYEKLLYLYKKCSANRSMVVVAAGFGDRRMNLSETTSFFFLLQCAAVIIGDDEKRAEEWRGPRWKGIVLFGCDSCFVRL